MKLASARIRGEARQMVKDLSGSLGFTADATLGTSFSTLDRRIRTAQRAADSIATDARGTDRIVHRESPGNELPEFAAKPE